MKISVVIEKDEDGYYAFAPELPGCQSQGRTFEEAETNMKEAVGWYLETMEPEERKALKNINIYTTTYDFSYA